MSPGCSESSFRLGGSAGGGVPSSFFLYLSRRLSARRGFITPATRSNRGDRSRGPGGYGAASLTAEPDPWPEISRV